MKLTFKDEDLQSILAQHVSTALLLKITRDDIFDFTYEIDENEDITGVSIEFEAPEAQPA